MRDWLRFNLSSAILSVMLAGTVWVIAINSDDPAEARTVPDPIAIQYVNLPEGLLLIDDPPGEATVTIRAPRSIWNKLLPEDVAVSVDLSGLGPGTHRLKPEGTLAYHPAQVIGVEPPEVMVSLEPAAFKEVTIEVETLGSPPLGYQTEEVFALPSMATVSGPATSVGRVEKLRAVVDISGRREDLEQPVRPVAVDSQGKPVTGLAVDPESVEVSVHIRQLGGYRDVAVKVVIEGQVLPGYRLTNVIVSPPIVTVSSSDPELVAALPGFVETEPLDLTNASDDIEERLSLNLPADISLVGEQSVLVQVSIAAIESSRTLTRKLELQGLSSGLLVVSSPDTVSVILTGPLPTLESLQPEDVRVIVDLRGLEPGTHQVQPNVTILPTGVVVETMLPSTIEVVISTQGMRTPTPNP
jgi:YbbR domain-containing protein